MKVKYENLSEEVAEKIDGLTRREFVDLYNFLFPCKMVFREDIIWDEFVNSTRPSTKTGAKINLPGVK